MGVLNVTPDSFSDGGRYFDRKKAITRALEMAAEGADIIDVGGESTRPGAKDVGAAEELDRVIPVIEGIAGRTKAIVSIDTRKALVAEKAVEKGARIINDVSGLRHDPRMAPVAAKSGAMLILMHMKGTPADMQVRPFYRDLIKEIKAGLRHSIALAKAAGVRERRIIIDPGIGFGKTVEHNLIILNRLGDFMALGRPICVGVSRKSFIGRILALEDPDERLAGTIGACAVAIAKGADILRVHDVKEAVQAAAIADSILEEKNIFN
jgi:dihydropteroate synthase